MSNRSKADTRDENIESSRTAYGDGTTFSHALGQRNLSKTAEVSQDSRRSRRLSVITRHACATCRKKRVKCDGQSPCETCKREITACVYETTIRHSKKELRAELACLRLRQQFFQHVFADLVEPERCERALARIRSGKLESLDLQWHSNSTVTFSNPSGPAAARLGRDSTTPLERQQLDAKGNNGLISHQDVYSTRLSQLTQNNSHSISVGQIPPVTKQTSLLDRWTSITDDNELIQHLLALYFCWEYPSFAPISKEHFLHDFYNMQPRYCSPMLLNALLALACHLSDRPIATIHTKKPRSLGDHFFEEAQRLFSTKMDIHSLTTVQALAIMSVRESRCSRLAESKYYADMGMRLALEMGLHAITVERDKDKLAVLSKTFWGVYALHQLWSMMTSTLPHCSYSLVPPPKPAVTAYVETSAWVPYLDGNTHLLPHIQQSNVRTVYRCLCSLSELIHESQYLLYSPERRLTAATLLQNYHRYLDWYDQLPDIVRLGRNSTPAVLFIHLHYHFAILLLFRRFIKLRITGSKELPWQVCIQSADAIQTLVNTYTKLYTLRRTPTFIPFFIFASATVYLSIDAILIQIVPSRIATESQICKALEQSIVCLTETAPYHPFAKRVLCILRRLSYKRDKNMDVDKGIATFDGHNSSVKPGTSSLNSSAQDFAVESLDSEANMGKGVTYSDKNAKVMCNMDTLWPMLFWFQDKTTRPTDAELQQTGFAMLQ